MSGVGKRKETRQSVKQRETNGRATKQIMADKETPDWAVHLITEVSGFNEVFKQSFTEARRAV